MKNQNDDHLYLSQTLKQFSIWYKAIGGDRDCVKLALLIAKYVTIALMDEDIRSNIDATTNPELCAMCTFYRDSECKECMLNNDNMIGCSSPYTELKAAAKRGDLYTLSYIIKSIVTKSNLEE